MGRIGRSWVLLAFCAVACVSCGGDDDHVGKLSGTYNGTFTTSSEQPGTMTLNLVDASSGLTGLFSDSFGTTGAVSGTVIGTAIELTVQPALASGSPGSCTSTISAQADRSKTLVGEFHTFGCPPPNEATRDQGPIRLTRP